MVGSCWQRRAQGTELESRWGPFSSVKLDGPSLVGGKGDYDNTRLLTWRSPPVFSGNKYKTWTTGVRKLVTDRPGAGEELGSDATGQREVSKDERCAGSDLSWCRLPHTSL